MTPLRSTVSRSQMISPEQSSYRDSIEDEPRRSIKILADEAQGL